MGGPTRWPLSVARPRVRGIVALLGGNVDELPLLRAARLAGTLRGASVQFCWMVGGRAAPARPLIRELALDADLDELSAGAFPALLDQGCVNAVMLAPTLWRRLNTALWRRLRHASVYLCRRASVPPANVLCCADSDATAAGLLDRLAEDLPEGASRLTLLRAVPPPPSWALGMLAVAGWALPAEDARTAGFSNVAGIPQLVIGAPVARAAAAACSTMDTNLLVLGWHQHALPLPERWLHRTAWRLSTSFPGDVLLVPLGD
jgi:hypothetical protein